MLYEEILKNGKCTFTAVSQEFEESKWLELRNTGIGGSDAGAVMGLNKYSSPLSVYLSKKGLTHFEGNEATRRGHWLEDPIRQKAIEDLGVVIETIPGMFTSVEYPFMNANLDGLIYAAEEKKLPDTEETIFGLGGHEIKTSGSGIGFSDDEIPDSYYAQVQHYMQVTGLNWFVLSVLIMNGNLKFRHYLIKRNQSFIDDMINAENDFWENFILKDIMPAPTGNENESELVKSLPMNDIVELDEECSAWLDEKEEIDSQIAELKEKSEALKEKVLLKMSNIQEGAENPEKVSAKCGLWKISISLQKRKSVDSAMMKKDGIYDKYSKESESKVVRITKSKSKE